MIHAHPNRSWCWFRYLEKDEQRDCDAENNVCNAFVGFGDDSFGYTCDAGTTNVKMPVLMPVLLLSILMKILKVLDQLRHPPAQILTSPVNLMRLGLEGTLVDVLMVWKVMAITVSISMNVLLTVIILVMPRPLATISSDVPNMNLVTLVHVPTILSEMAMPVLTLTNAIMVLTTVVIILAARTMTMNCPVKLTSLALAMWAMNKIFLLKICFHAKISMNVPQIRIIVLLISVYVKTMKVVSHVNVSLDITVMVLLVLTTTNVLVKIMDTFAEPIPSVTISPDHSNACALMVTLIWKMLSSMEPLPKSVLISSTVLTVKTIVMPKMPSVTKLLVWVMTVSVTHVHVTLAGLSHRMQDELVKTKMNVTTENTIVILTMDSALIP